MTLRKLVGLAAIGGFLYAHKKRGGQMNLESFKSTARGLMDDAKLRARDLKSRAENKIDEAREEFASKSTGDDVTGYGSSGYGYGSNEFTNKRY